VPESQQPEAGQAMMVERIRAMKPRRIIDVGAGPGKWGRILRDVAPVTALEIWPPYVEEFNLSTIYPDVVCEDARLYIGWELFDVAILGDVLEHMPKDDARALVARLDLAGVSSFLSIPVTDCPQRGDPFGNPYEEHVAQWTHDELVAEGWTELHRGPVPSGLATVGTYYRGNVPPHTSIVISSRNRSELLRRTLDSIREQRYGDTECLVLDDGSTDGTRRMLEQYSWVRTTLVDRPGNQYLKDPAEIFNFMMFRARGQVLIQQSAEVVHLTPVARQLTEACERGTVAFATVLAGDMHGLAPVADAVRRGWIGVGGGWSSLDVRTWIDPDGIRPDGGAGTSAPPFRIRVGGYPVEVYTGGQRQAPYFFCGAIHRDDFDRSGGYSEGLSHGASDLHLAFTLARQGVKFKFLPGAVAYHVDHDKR
jgi:hypothetical protein